MWALRDGRFHELVSKTNPETDRISMPGASPAASALKFKSYQKGGLKLVEIDTKVKTMRIQWLYKLTTKPVSDIERHLADNLIGEYRGIKGIDILNHTTETRLLRSINQFYSRAIEYWRALDIEFKVASLQSIRNITIYHNKLLVNSNNEVFNFF